MHKKTKKNFLQVWATIAPLPISLVPRWSRD